MQFLYLINDFFDLETLNFELIVLETWEEPAVTEVCTVESHILKGNSFVWNKATVSFLS